MTNVDAPNSVSVASRRSRSLLVAEPERDERTVVVLEESCRFVRPRCSR